MCAHLQPQVSSIQRENPGYWYIQALYAALVRLDTDLDDRDTATRNSRRSSRIRDSLRRRSSSRADEGRSKRSSTNTIASHRTDGGTG